MNNNPYKIKYDLATNFDRELISGIKKFDSSGQIKTVFGKLRKDIVGGGRSSMTLPQLSMNELKGYVDLCHKHNLEFNYLLNAACLGNRETNPKYHKHIIKYISTLSDMGIDSITVSVPYLCELIKKQFPHLKITIGVAGGIFNCKHIVFWEALGANELTLVHAVNRNFILLEDMLNCAKNRNIGLRLIANNVCVHECPFKYNHATAQSHSSQKGVLSSDMHIDYNLLRCNNTKIKHTEHLIASEWIRPEDIHYYEELCNKTGNHKFSVKLLDRTKTTEFLLRVVKAYTEQQYDGNLIDILNWPSKKDTKVLHKLPMILRVLTNSYNISELRKYAETFNLPEIIIDNKKLNGFLEKFVNNNDCFNKICDHEIKNHGNNTLRCNYCANWAKKAISYDQGEIDKWIEKSDASLEALKYSKYYN